MLRTKYKTPLDNIFKCIIFEKKCTTFERSQRGLWNCAKIQCIQKGSYDVEAFWFAQAEPLDQPHRTPPSRLRAQEYETHSIICRKSITILMISMDLIISSIALIRMLMKIYRFNADKDPFHQYHVRLSWESADCFR